MVPDEETMMDEPPPRPSRMPWLLSALLAASLLAVGAKQLEDRSQHRRDIAVARDEAGEMRRQMLVSQDQNLATDRARLEDQQRAEALAGQLAARTNEHGADEKLIADLRSKLDTKDGEVSGDANRVSVSLVDEILFKSGDAHLSPRGEKVLGRVGGVLKQLTDKQILIGGHTDDVPIHTAEFASNWELSSARAVNVVRYLAETVGVDPTRLTSAGYSQFHPRSRDRAKNRRIEILLTPFVQIKKSK